MTVDQDSAKPKKYPFILGSLWVELIMIIAYTK